MSRKSFRRILYIMAVFALVFMNCPLTAARAAGAQTAALRIITTTDLHGQVSTMHYDFGSPKYGCLAQAYTLIQQARLEAGETNTLTLDAGDSIFGYAADFIVNNSDANVVQPIYQAMAYVNYDAITLGNHDFDYGYAYIMKQLELSGLKEKCVVSNVISNDTGESPWNETKLVKKTLQTADGRTVEVTIGLIGVTVPSLSGYSNCTEDLTGLPIVKSADRAAQKLKAEGADLVVAIAHSSFGKANPPDDAKNAVYALAMLDSVDAVAAGHAHKNYPSDEEGSASFYKLKNVDKATGLVNGKPVTMTADHGAGIGIMDLKLEISPEGNVRIAQSSTSLRMTAKDTAVNQDIVNTQNAAIQPVDESLTQEIGTITSDKKIESYFALLEDNYAIQLVNESKIQYGLAYTGGSGKARYADYPVLAMTNYKLCNSQSSRDNISLDGSITMKDILNMQQAGHNNNIIYWIDGNQLRELLEWSASIYSTADGKITSDEALAQLLEKRGAKSIVDSEWLEDWGAFAVIDGVEYTVDAAQNARYTKLGTLKNESAHRILSLTYNGQPVASDQKFMLVCDDIASNDAAKGIENQKVLGRVGVNMAYKNLAAYIRQQQAFGSLKPNTNHNWNVLFDSSSSYIVRSSIFSQPEAALQAWFRGLAETNEAFAYYLAQFVQAEAADHDAPLLVAAAVETETVNGPVEIKVQANDGSGIAQVKYTSGQAVESSALWEQAAVVTGGAFTVDANDIYSVLAEDMHGNRTVKYVNVSNIDPQFLAAPTIKKVTNKSDFVTGKAAYGTTVHIYAGGLNYEAAANEKDTYSCEVDYLKAGSEVIAYCTDSLGRESRAVSTIVFKEGPDMPMLDPVSNKSTRVSGRYTGSAPLALVMFTQTTAYCSSQGQELYENSPAFREGYTVELANYVQNGEKFRMDIPLFDADEPLEFVAIDKVGRTSVTLETMTVDAAPDIPRIQEVCSAETYIRGSVTSAAGSGTVQVIVGNQKFTGKITKDGTFAVKTNGLEQGQTVYIAAKDVKDGVSRTSLKASVIVQPYKKFLNMGMFEIQAVYSNETKIKGRVEPGYTAYINVQGKQKQLITNGNGKFVYTLKKPLPKAEKLYFIARSESGLEDVAMQKVLKAKPAKKPKKPKKGK